MAQGVGSTKQILGLLQTFGGLYWSPLDYSGPASYVQGGDAIGATSFGFNNTIWALVGSVDQSGVARLEPPPPEQRRDEVAACLDCHRYLDWRDRWADAGGGSPRRNEPLKTHVSPGCARTVALVAINLGAGLRPGPLSLRGAISHSLT